MRIGVIADTHGLLRPEVLSAFAGVDQIFHAGDVGDASILDRLRALARVTAIRGNIDRSGSCAALPAEEYVSLSSTSIYLVHDVHTLSLDPSAAGVGAVIFGHSHRPVIEHRKGVLFFNPGAAGPRRFSLPVMVGFLHVEGDSLRAEHLPLV